MADETTRSDDAGGDGAPPRREGRPEGPRWGDGGRRGFPSVEGYEILSELGRGSVGVVYKARQLALDRLVALKMVMAGGHVAPDQLARFRSEALAVAALQHPNIIQIHEIGESNGLPYLSLEYFEGVPLDRHLDGQPQPPADAIRLVETLSRAVHFAHLHNIVHRDLKPANVILGPDGTAKITDFGLAKNLEDKSSHTKTGTLLGTPSYMAPEQACGDHASLGPAVDIHALGALLYEMLVGRPAFLGESPYETTMQVVNQEAVSPSRLVPRLPVDIDTICLKCLQKDPSKRYLSAAALAEDCRRFLDGEPILSRPVSRVERAWRWCRRNPRVASLGATVAGLLVIVATGSSLAALSIAHERNLKEDQRREADRARVAAEEASLDAQEAQQEADANAKLASRQADLALTTIQLLVDKVQARLDDAPRTQRLKRELLETAIDGLKEVAQEAEGSSRIEATRLAAHMRIGAILRGLGATDEAMREFELCNEIARKRAADQPDNYASQGNLAVVLAILGDMHQEFDRDMATSVTRYEQALAIWRGLHERPASSWDGPDVAEAIAQNFAEACTKVGVTKLRLGDLSGAVPLIGEGAEVRRRLVEAHPDNLALRKDLVRSDNAMAEVEFLSGRTSAARLTYEACVASHEALLAADPEDVVSRFEFASMLGNFGDFCIRTGDFSSARRHFDRSLDINRNLLLLDGDNVDFQRAVGVDLYRQGTLDAIEGDGDSATRRFNDCVSIREPLVARDPRNQARRMELMLSLARCGDHVRAAEIADSAQGDRADPELLLTLARCYAQCSVAARGGGMGGAAGSSARPADAELSDAYAARAVKAIREAHERGYRDRISIDTDPDLAPIRTSPEFMAAISALLVP